ncbi:lysozyme [uncultured Acinetobacter sp.]|uniref:lysozyme n=1 Tax=uncultured Acinetobacter sp. TaxID=165433 RepID=UPI0026392303|nr:lysozyme [uncultured Acinetobacter sp.]
MYIIELKSAVKSSIIFMLKRLGLLDVGRAESNLAVAQDQIMHISQQGMDLITQCEGLKLNAYLCPAHVWTIGIGTTVYPNGKRVQQGDACTHAQAVQYKQHDLKRFVQLVNQTVYVELNQNQFDALVCLAYNIGAQAFRQSTLVKTLNTGDYKSASEQFLVWNQSRGQVLKGLVRRRAQERQLFLSQR